MFKSYKWFLHTGSFVFIFFIFFFLPKKDLHFNDIIYYIHVFLIFFFSFF